MDFCHPRASLFAIARLLAGGFSHHIPLGLWGATESQSKDQIWVPIGINFGR
jgi:hypothetical protein